MSQLEYHITQEHAYSESIVNTVTNKTIYIMESKPASNVPDLSI